jgi:hypothetical protein
MRQLGTSLRRFCCARRVTGRISQGSRAFGGGRVRLAAARDPAACLQIDQWANVVLKAPAGSQEQPQDPAGDLVAFLGSLSAQHVNELR